MILVVFRARSVLVQHGRVHPPIRKKAGVGSLRLRCRRSSFIARSWMRSTSWLTLRSGFAESFSNCPYEIYEQKKMGIMSCFLGRRGKGLPCKSKFSRVKQHFLMCLTHADDDVWERERGNKRRGESKSCVLGRSWGSLLVLWVFRTELEALTKRWDLGCNLNSMFFFGGGAQYK